MTLLRPLSALPVLGIFASLAASAPAIHAQLLSDDFESYTPDSNLGTSGPWSSATAGLQVRDEATATPFGSPNQYFDWNDDDGSFSPNTRSANIAELSNAVSTYAFTFNEPSSGGGGAFIFGYALPNSDLNSTGKRVVMNLDDGFITGLSTTDTNTYALDTAHRIYVVFNDTINPVDYSGGTIPAEAAHVWIHPIGSSPVFAGTRTAENAFDASYLVGFRSFSSTLQQVLIDDVTLDTGIVLPDADPPAVAGTLPVDDDPAVFIDQNPVITFDRSIIPGSGIITLHKTSDDSTVASFDVSDPLDVDFNGPDLTLVLPSDLDISTEYYVLIPSTAVESVTGVAFGGISDTTEWSFTTVADATPPTLASTNPADEATGVLVDSNLVATFDEPIAPGTGSIVITNLTEATTFATLDVMDATQVTISGSSVTINPTDDLREGRTYAVEIDPGAVTDTTGNPYVGLTGTEAWNFDTVADTTDPVLVSTNPADDQTQIVIGANLTATFDEPILVGTGDLIIRNVTDSADFAVIPVGDAQVSVSGSSLTIDPAANLSPGKVYAIQIAPGAVTDLSGNGFAGIVAPDVTTWNFSTVMLSSEDHIVGEREASGSAEDYYVDSSSNVVGVSGAGGSRTDRNVVLGFTLPTLPPGETVETVDLFFEITEARNPAGPSTQPDLQVYLLDTANPDSSGTTFYYHGPGDPSVDVAIVGATSAPITDGSTTGYADDEQDRVISLTGDALTLLRSFYGGDNVPDQTEAFFRFNLSEDPAINQYVRYRVDTGDNESGLQIGSASTDPAVIVSTLPADDASTVSPTSPLVATFDKTVQAGTGNITILNLTDSTTFATVPVGDASVTISGNELTLVPVTPFDLGKDYAVQLDAGAVENFVGAPSAAVSDTTTWNFRTSDASIAASSTDNIVGRAQINSTQAVGYYPDSGFSQVGIGGASTQRNDRNVVFGYTLPTLPVGTTLSEARFTFEVTGYRNHSGADPALDVYLLDTPNPDGSGTTFFYHGPGDTNPDTTFVGQIDISEPQSAGQVSYADDEQDQTITLTGPALALLQSYYGGDHIPERTEVFFRLNLDNLIIGTGDADLNGATFDRYFIDFDTDESSLELAVSGGAGPTGYAAWIAGFDVGGLTDQGDDPDEDGVSNELEFAFGTDPSVPDAGSLTWDGNLGNPATPGAPVVHSDGGGITARFMRRKGSDLTYAWRFSADLSDWESSGDAPQPGWVEAPTVLVDDTSGDYELVEVPFPAALDNTEAAQFFQLEATAP